MERLKRELLLLCRERDVGKVETQGEWVAEFFDALEGVLTPAAVATFDVEQIRTAYVAFMCEVKQVGLEPAREALPMYFRATSVRRNQLVFTPEHKNVHSII